MKTIDQGTITSIVPGKDWSLLKDLLGEDPEIYCFSRSRTKVDVGSWIRKRRVATFLTSDELVILAAGRRPYIESIPIADLGESRYNHVTGEFVPAPAPDRRLDGLKIQPHEALKLMANINKE